MMCANFHAKQTKFELLYARKCDNTNPFNTIVNTKYCCAPSFMLYKPSLNYFMRQSAKTH